MQIVVWVLFGLVGQPVVMCMVGLCWELVQIVALLRSVMVERSMYVRVGLSTFGKVAPHIGWCLVWMHVRK